MMNTKIKNFITKSFFMITVCGITTFTFAGDKIISRKIEIEETEDKKVYQSLQNEINFLTKKVENLEQELYNLRNNDSSEVEQDELKKNNFLLEEKNVKNDNFEEDIFNQNNNVAKINSNAISKNISINEKASSKQKSDKQESESKKLYKVALGALKEKRYEEAEKRFGEFIKKYSDDNLAGNAYYWYAESYAKLNNHDKAAINYLKGYKNYPTSEKAADSLLKLSLSLEKLGKLKEAKQVLLKLKEEFPKRTTAQIKATEDAFIRIRSQ